MNKNEASVFPERERGREREKERGRERENVLNGDIV